MTLPIPIRIFRLASDGTALRHLGHNKDREYPEPATLFDDYANRGLAVKDQDMTIEKTFTQLDAKLTPPTSLNAEQLKTWNAFYEPRNEAFRKAKLSGKDLVRWRYQRYMHDYLATIRLIICPSSPRRQSTTCPTSSY